MWLGVRATLDQHEDTAESVSDYALQGASPTRPPESHLAIGEEAAQQAGGPAEEKWRSGGEHKSDSRQVKIVSQIGRNPGREERPAGVAAEIHQAQRPQSRAEKHCAPGKRSGLPRILASLRDQGTLGFVHGRIRLG